MTMPMKSTATSPNSAGNVRGVKVSNGKPMVVAQDAKGKLHEVEVSEIEAIADPPKPKTSGT